MDCRIPIPTCPGERLTFLGGCQFHGGITLYRQSLTARRTVSEPAISRIAKLAAPYDKEPSSYLRKMRMIRIDGNGAGNQLASKKADL